MNANDNGVLAVMRASAERERLDENGHHAIRMEEASAAVAELVNRAQQTLERFEDDHDMRDLRAAIARCGGES